MSEEKNTIEENKEDLNKDKSEDNKIIWEGEAIDIDDGGENDE